MRWVVLYMCCVGLLVTVESVPSGAIVRLSCATCRGCCFGVLVAPNLGLTTAFCANSCQYIVRKNHTIPILNTRSYRRNNIHAPVTNDIALFVFRHENNKISNFVKISAVEAQSLIGRKAYLPILDTENVYLTPTVLLSCEGRYQKLRGYYVCSSKPFGVNSLHRGKQGVPLFFNNCLLAISGFTDTHLSQNAFIALAPLLTWIGTAADSLKDLSSTDDIKSDFREQRKILRQHTRNGMTKATNLDSKIHLSTKNSTVNISDEITKVTKSKEVHLFFGADGVDDTDSLESTTVRNLQTYFNTKAALRHSLDNVTLTKTLLNETRLIPSNISTDDTSITATPKDQVRATEASKVEINTLNSSTIKVTDWSTVRSSTDVMDWFRMVKATIGRETPKVLIMNTPSSIEEVSSTTNWDSIVVVKSYDPAPTFEERPVKSASTPFKDLT